MKTRSKDEQLFALMLYKNVDAKDFKAAHERSGLLYTLFQKKQELISDLIDLKKLDKSNRNSTTMRDLLIFFEDEVSSICIKSDSNESEEKKNAREFLFYLIRNGYIDEKYMSLISHEYRGQLNANDFLFLKSVKNFQATDPDYHIDNVSIVYSMLKEDDLWMSPGILNYKLLDHALRVKDSAKISNFVQTMLRYEIAEKSDFFKKHKDQKNRRALFPYLFKNDLNFDWNLLLGKGSTKLFWQLVSAMTAFNRTDLKDCMKKYFEDNEQFFKNPGKIKSNLYKMKENKLIFKNLRNIGNEEYLDFIKKNNLYELNIGNLNLLTHQSKGSQRQLLEKCFLDSCIRKYIDDNIEDFIRETFNSVSFKHEEQGDLVYRVLLSPNIDENFAIKFIPKYSTKISDFEKFIYLYGLRKGDLNKSVVKKLFEFNKIQNTENNRLFEMQFFR